MSDVKQRSEGVRKLRAELYEQFKKKGLLKQIKTNLRAQLIQQFRSSASPLNANKPAEEPLLQRVINGMIAGYLRSSKYEYSYSIFNSECCATEPLCTGDMLEVMKIGSSPGQNCFLYEFLQRKGVLSPTAAQQQAEGDWQRTLLASFVDSIVQWPLSVDRVAISCQTEPELAGDEHLDQKLRRIDDEYVRNVLKEESGDGSMVEERMLAFQARVAADAREEIETEIKRFKSQELFNMQEQERARYNKDVEKVRAEGELMHSQRLEQLRLQESKLLARVQEREQAVESYQYEQRQKHMVQMERMQEREFELSKKAELARQALALQDDKYQHKLAELDTRLQDVNAYRSDFEGKLEAELRRRNAHLSHVQDEHERMKELHVRHGYTLAEKEKCIATLEQALGQARERIDELSATMEQHVESRTAQEEAFEEAMEARVSEREAKSLPEQHVVQHHELTTAQEHDTQALVHEIERLNAELDIMQAGESKVRALYDEAQVMNIHLEKEVAALQVRLHVVEAETPLSRHATYPPHESRSAKEDVSVARGGSLHTHKSGTSGDPHADVNDADVSSGSHSDASMDLSAANGSSFTRRHSEWETQVQSQLDRHQELQSREHEADADIQQYFSEMQKTRKALLHREHLAPVKQAWQPSSGATLSSTLAANAMRFSNASYLMQASGTRAPKHPPISDFQAAYEPSTFSNTALYSKEYNHANDRVYPSDKVDPVLELKWKKQLEESQRQAETWKKWYFSQSMQQLAQNDASLGRVEFPSEMTMQQQQLQEVQREAMRRAVADQQRQQLAGQQGYPSKDQLFQQQLHAYLQQQGANSTSTAPLPSSSQPTRTPPTSSSMTHTHTHTHDLSTNSGYPTHEKLAQLQLEKDLASQKSQRSTSSGRLRNSNFLIHQSSSNPEQSALDDSLALSGAGSEHSVHTEQDSVGMEVPDTPMSAAISVVSQATIRTTDFGHRPAGVSPALSPVKAGASADEDSVTEVLPFELGRDDEYSNDSLAFELSEDIEEVNICQGGTEVVAESVDVSASLDADVDVDVVIGDTEVETTPISNATDNDRAVEEAQAAAAAAREQEDVTAALIAHQQYQHEQELLAVEREKQKAQAEAEADAALEAQRDEEKKRAEQQDALEAAARKAAEEEEKEAAALEKQQQQQQREDEEQEAQAAEAEAERARLAAVDAEHSAARAEEERVAREKQEAEDAVRKAEEEKAALALADETEMERYRAKAAERHQRYAENEQDNATDAKAKAPEDFDFGWESSSSDKHTDTHTNKSDDSSGFW
jgi:hypothetical protein